MRAPGDWVPIPPHELATRCAWPDAGESLIFGGADNGSLLRLSELLQRLRELAGKLRIGRAAGFDRRIGFTQVAGSLAHRGQRKLIASRVLPGRALQDGQAADDFPIAAEDRHRNAEHTCHQLANFADVIAAPAHIAEIAGESVPTVAQAGFGNVSRVIEVKTLQPPRRQMRQDHLRCRPPKERDGAATAGSGNAGSFIPLLVDANDAVVKQPHQQNDGVQAAAQLRQLWLRDAKQRIGQPHLLIECFSAAVASSTVHSGLATENRLRTSNTRSRLLIAVNGRSEDARRPSTTPTRRVSPE